MINIIMLRSLTNRDWENIMRDVDPEKVPVEYIEAISVSMRDGNEMLMSPQDFEDFVRKERLSQRPLIAEVRVFIDFYSLKKKVRSLTEEILENSEPRE